MKMGNGIVLNGERDHNKLTVVRRTCGYIGSTFWNKGKTQEINDRVLHI